MIIIIPTIKYGSTYYNTFTMGVCNKYLGYFFQCTFYENLKITAMLKMSKTFTLHNKNSEMLLTN